MRCLWSWIRPLRSRSSFRRIDGLEGCVDELEDAVGDLMVDANRFSPSDDLVGAVDRLEPQNESGLRQFQEHAQTSIQEAILESIRNEITFDYIKDEEIKGRLLGFLEEVKVTFRSRAFRSCVVLQRAILEAILVYALNQNRGNATKQYEEIYRDRALRSGNGTQGVEWWQLMELVNVGKRLGILTTKGIADDCREFNAYRNTIHIHNRASGKLRIGSSTCQLGFYCLRAVNTDIAKGLSN